MAVDKGAPSKQLKRRASTDSNPPSPQEDLQDNTCIDTQHRCVDDEHVSPSAPSQVLPLTWHYYMWLHAMYDTLNIILVNKIRVPVSRTYNIYLSHHVLTSKYICSEELNCYSFFLSA